MPNKSYPKRVPLPTQLDGVQAWLVPDTGNPYLLVELDKPARTLNSSPWGGGQGYHKYLLNRQVDLTYNCNDPIAEMEAFLQAQRLEPRETACLMTAAQVAEAAVESAAYGEARVTGIVTVGLSNKARAGLALPSPQLYPGTINTIVLVRGIMTDAAMVNAVMTATEAKAAALQALDERVEGKLHATGTTSDAVLIAALGSGPLHRYAGTVTEVGYLIGRTVYESTMTAGRRYQAYRKAKQG
jgi:adenosylcobinamide hydrolase